MKLRRVLQEETVDHVGYREPVVVQNTATVEQALQVMQKQRVGCLLVLQDGDLVGIFTERDLLRKVLRPGAPLTSPIQDLMTPGPVVARRDEAIADVLSRMYAGGFRHLPVLDRQDQLLGTISMARVVRFIADQYPEAVYNLPPDPDHYGVAREGA